MNQESGQATVEWVGVVLLVTLALGAALAWAPGVEGRELGRALARSITCAARGGCEQDRRAEPALALAASTRPTRLRGVSSARRPRLPSLRFRIPPERVAAAYRVLRGAKAIARRAWVACLGWERYRYERRHPEATLPGHRMPVAEALRIAEACLNPVSFITENRPP